MRSSSTLATILTLKQSGENNRTVTLLTPADGIVWATLYGGPKSRLRSLVSPFNSGTVWLYRDETKNSCKLTDFDVKSYHPSFRENLFKTYAASFASEILIKSRCAGSPEQAFYLLNGLLDGMEKSTENNSRLGLVRFLWRYTGLLGTSPDVHLCCQCGKSLAEEPYAAYMETENGLVCSDCLPPLPQGSSGRIMLSGASITYLQAVATLEPKEVRKIIIGEKTLAELKDFCYFLIQNACGTRFLSLESGIAVL